MLICIEFASEPVNCSGFHTGEGVRSPIVLSKFDSVVTPCDTLKEYWHEAVSTNLGGDQEKQGPAS